MAQHRRSRQDLVQQRLRDGFVGRAGEVAVFRDNLARDPEDPDFQFLFHVHGLGGVGKTTLLRYWEHLARDSGAVTARVGDEVHSAVEAMEAVAGQLEKQGRPLKKFTKQAGAYRRRRHELETSQDGFPSPSGQREDGGPGGSPAASLSSAVVTQIGLAGLGLIPGVGGVANALDPQQAALGTEKLRSALAGRFRSHEDLRLVLTPVDVLTPVFLAELSEAAERSSRVVLFFDTFERTAPLLERWLRDITLDSRHGTLPVNVQTVLCGQGRLDRDCWGGVLDLVQQVPLEVFTEDEARQLLAAHDVTDQQVVDVILDLSGRLPAWVAALGQARPLGPGAVGDPADSAVERFLKWETDSDRRRTALACALPRQLNEDLYRLLAPESLAGEYAWMRGLTFVSGDNGHCRYHDVVRTAMLRLQRAQSPMRWEAQHTLLARAHREKRRALEPALEAAGLWKDPAWRQARLEEIYHGLCADPAGALPYALEAAIQAGTAGSVVLHRCARTIAQAGHDTGDEGVAAWGRRLSATEDDAVALARILTALTTASELSDEYRALTRSGTGAGTGPGRAGTSAG
ncbi:hypothetical protein [Streptomyces daqingensis]|uniref:hypothetical protein n=1 Tax=Streptomyces daqingensis TaxID=1472640 RepID=UPI001668DCBD|nr:hypothetical protein [Streptomyces daqingensis]